MLLEKDSPVSIHDRNIQCLATEMYKVSNRLSPPVADNIFSQKYSHPKESYRRNTIYKNFYCESLIIILFIWLNISATLSSEILKKRCSSNFNLLSDFLSKLNYSKKRVLTIQ